MDNELPSATWKDRLLFFFGRRRGYVIGGDSMSPTLNNGDAVIINPGADASEGDIVLAKHPFKMNVKIVKRVAEILPDGNLMLKGDNPVESTDSRNFGSISKDRVIGKLVCRL